MDGTCVCKHFVNAIAVFDVFCGCAEADADAP